MTELEARSWVIHKESTVVNTMEEAKEYLESFPGIVSPGDFSDPTIDHPGFSQEDLCWVTEWDKQIKSNWGELYQHLYDFPHRRAILAAHILTESYNKTKLMDYQVGFYAHVIGHDWNMYEDATFLPVAYGRYSDLVKGLESKP